MRHILPTALALLLAFAGFASEVPVAPREIGPSAGPNIRPLLVPSGNEFVAVWSGPHQPQFARIRHSNEILQAGDFGRPGAVAAAVAGPNGSVLVAFSDADGIRIATITPGGEVRMSDRVSQSFSSMAWNGTALLVVTREGDTLITDADGRVLHHGVRLTLDNDGISSASARGSGFAVAWATVNDIFVTTLLNTGQVAKEEKIADRQIGVAGIGCNPAGTCLLLSAQREPLSGQILGDTPGPLLPLSQDLAGDAIPPVWDGQRFLVAWTDYTFGQSMHAEVEVAAVALNGTVTPVATITSPGRNRDTPAIAHANGETVVVWSEGNRCGYAGSQIVARSLVTNHDLRLTSGLSSQWDPAIAAGPTNTLIAWAERTDVSRIRARFHPFTEPAFDISSGTGAAAPVVATDGSGGYLVVWRETRLAGNECRSELLASAVGSGKTFTLGQDADYEIDAVQVTWNGSEYAVLWEQSEPTQLFAIRVARSGQPIDPIAVSLTQAEQRPDSFTMIDHQPAGLFWTGNGYLLLWRRSRQTYIPWYPDPPPQYDIRALRLGPHLYGLAAPQILGPGFYLAAAMKGNSIVAVWKPTGTTMHAIRLSADGTVIENRDLGIADQPARIVATRSGYALQTWNEILFLDDDLTVVGRRPDLEYNAAIAETPAGLAEVYQRADTVFLDWPHRRRRTLR
ncbi:MAG TPA: hypothetical protein VF432_16805 [Thermoanaerobaculia bacterium]